MSLPIIRQIPPALPLDKLREALANNFLECQVSQVDRDGVKVTPCKGVERAEAVIFLEGFVAGFES